MLPKKDKVLTSKNGSINPVSKSGNSATSLFSAFANPGIEDPSTPIPSLTAFFKVLEGIVM
jgi:hypothetical protein